MKGRADAYLVIRKARIAAYGAAHADPGHIPIPLTGTTFPCAAAAASTLSGLTRQGIRSALEDAEPTPRQRSCAQT